MKKMSSLRHVPFAMVRWVTTLTAAAGLVGVALAQVEGGPQEIDLPDKPANVQGATPDLSQPYVLGQGPSYEVAVPHFRSTYDIIPELYPEWSPPRIKKHDPKPGVPGFSSTAASIEADPNTGPSISAANLLRNWDSVGPNGWIPPDPNIAAGPNHVLVVTNDDWAFYNKHGDLQFQVDYNDWFGDGDFLFDPVCFYDTHDQRFVFVVLKRDDANLESYWIVCISDDNNPNGNWWWYYFNARLDGGNNTNNWADYPSCGFDSDAVYITSNQYQWGDGFQYAKFRILDKAEIYTASGAGWYDFWNFGDGGGVTSHTLRAVQIHSFPSTAYIVNCHRTSGDYVILWKVSDPLGSPTVTGTKLTVGAYSTPPDGGQPDTGIDIDNIDARLLNAVYWMNQLWTAHSVSHDWGGGTVAAIKYYNIYTPTPSITNDVIWGADNLDYYYPAICVNEDADMAMVFARSGETEYASIRHTGRRTGDASTQGSAQLKAGTGAYTGGRWGDFFGISLDGGDENTFWIYGQYALSGNSWDTYIGEISFTKTADVTIPTWAGFSPTQTTDQTPNCQISASDTWSGLYPASAQYWYSLDAGSTFFGPFGAGCTGSDGSTGPETVSANSVPFNQDSMSQNAIWFYIEDMFGNAAGTGWFTVQVDGTAPAPWGSVSPAQTTDQTPNLTITIRDVTSGLNVGSGLYWYSRDGGATFFGPFAAGCTGANGTTATQTESANSVPFNQDSMSQNAVWFYIQDMFGNAAGTGWLTVQVDGTAPGDWQNFSPNVVVNGGLQTCSVQVRDLTSGLDVSTAQYRYSTNGGGSWSAWAGAACTGADGTTAFQTVSASVPFNQHDLAGNNQVQFRVTDMFGNTGTSGAYGVLIDKVSHVVGGINLGQWVGNETGMPFSITLYNGAVPVETVNSNILNAAGAYDVWFESTGGTSLRIKPVHHLSVSQAAVLNGLAVNNYNWNVPLNGDGDGNNSVGLPDLNIVLINFGAGATPGDYDGNGSTELADANIVLLNFGQNGT